MRTTVLLICFLTGAGGLLAQKSHPTPLEWGESPNRRFELKMSGTHERSDSRLDKQVFAVYDPSGNEASREEIGGESLKSENDLLKGVYYESMFQVELGYRVWSNLKVWLGIGLAQVGERTKIKETDMDMQYSVSKSVVPTYKFGLSYSHLLSPRLFLHLAPSVRYLQTKNLLHANLDDSEGMIDSNDLDQKHSSLTVEVPLSVGYAFGKVIPRIGIMYRDCFVESTFAFDKQYIGETYRVENINKISSRDKIRGFAACDFQFARNLSLGASASVGRTYSAQLTLSVQL